MNREAINILVITDESSLIQIKTLLTSLFITNPHQKFNVYFLSDCINVEKTEKLKNELLRINCDLYPVKIDSGKFAEFKISDERTRRMYYQMFACEFLPENINKILYLDTDTLVINSIRELYDKNIDRFMFAAAEYVAEPTLGKGTYKKSCRYENKYYDTGVLLINLIACREKIKYEDLLTYTHSHEKNQNLPNQDILNSLYCNNVSLIDDCRWNYDVRKWDHYFLSSNGVANMDWVMENTAVLHFCGKNKPWKDTGSGVFKTIYRHYMMLSRSYTEREADQNGDK